MERREGSYKKNLARAGAVSAFFCLAVTGCISEEDHARVLREKGDLERRVLELEEVIESNEDRLTRVIESKEVELKEGAAEKVKVEVRVRELEEELEALQEKFEAYQKEYKVSQRAKAADREIGRLVLRDGKTYEGAVIREVSPEGFRIFHSAGAATVGVELLPQVFWDEFAFSIEEAVAFREDQRSLAKDGDPSIVIELDDLRKKNAPKDKVKNKAAELRRTVVIWQNQADRMRGSLQRHISIRRQELAAGKPSTRDDEIQELSEKIKSVERMAARGKRYLETL